MTPQPQPTQTACRTNSTSREGSTRAEAEAIAESLGKFYAMVGNPPEVKGAIAMMAETLVQMGATHLAVRKALFRCSKECLTYAIRLPHIVARIEGLEVSSIDAEMRAAWDVLTKFVSKWCRWGEDYQSAYVESGAPKLPERVVDSVRRTGGWTAYLNMNYTDDKRARDAAFLQQRFYEEYKAWTAVERVLSDLTKVLPLLGERKPLQLVKPMESVKNPAAVKNPNSIKILARIPAPLTEAQVQDRRRILEQQASAILQQRGQACAAD